MKRAWMYLERDKGSFYQVPVGEHCRVTSVEGRLGERFAVVGRDRVCGPWCGSADPVLARVYYEFYVH